MVKILDIEKKSIAAELEILPGSLLLSINGKKINDNLDYRFHSSGEDLEILIEQNGEQIIFEVEKENHEDLGLVLEDLTMRKCGNKCVFCFVHQNPRGLRKSLYFKDEDYRFSFLYGHYVTLTNTRQKDLDRIVTQRLSPIYVSVHVTDPDLRKYMLGIKYDDFLLEKLEFLTGNGIQIHTQIVLCPQLNDGSHLERTIADLMKLYPGVGSVAIVPVGLTRHRRNLPPLKPVTKSYSLQLMADIEKMREKIRQKIGSAFVYLSDEFYIRTGTPIPQSYYYEDFYQLENGVGLTRDFIDRFHAEYDSLKNIPYQGSLTFVSGKLGSMALKKYFIPKLEQIPGLRISLETVANKFFGESIVVSGLLVGQDIYDTLKDNKLGDYVVLPPRVLNHDGIFLDDWTVEELEQKLQRKTIIFPGNFSSLFSLLNEKVKSVSEKSLRKRRHQSPAHYIAEPMKGGEDW